MTIQPVLIYNIFIAKGKSCGSAGFCTKATSCSAKKEGMSEEKDTEVNSYHSKRKLIAEVKSCSSKKGLKVEEKSNSCNSKRELITEASSCSSKRLPEPNNEEPEKGCAKSDCGPFTICSYCCIIPMDRPVFSFSYFIQKTEKARLINENISSNYVSDNWHPPEFI